MVRWWSEDGPTIVRPPADHKRTTSGLYTEVHLLRSPQRLGTGLPTPAIPHVAPPIGSSYCFKGSVPRFYLLFLCLPAVA